MPDPIPSPLDRRLVELLAEYDAAWDEARAAPTADSVRLRAVAERAEANLSQALYLSGVESMLVGTRLVQIDGPSRVRTSLLGRIIPNPAALLVPHEQAPAPADPRRL